MGTRSDFAHFESTNSLTLRVLESCIRDLSSNQPRNHLKGHTFHQVALYQSNPNPETVGVIKGKLVSRGKRDGSALGRGGVNALTAVAPIGAQMGIGAVAAGQNIAQNVAVTIPLKIPGLTPNGINLGFGPIGAAVGPWIAAGTIMHKFRHVNGVSLSDLHKFYPDGYDAYCTQCGPAPAHDLGWGMGKSERRWKTCEDSCWYFADANDCRAAIKGASVFLGAVSLGILPLAYAIGNGVKNAAGQRRRKFEFEVQDGISYLRPQVGAKWEPDEDKCSFCDTEIGSINNIFKRIGRRSSRHHCRLCGKNYCGEHCSIKVPMIAPLEPGHEVTSESGRKVHGKYKFTRNTTPIPGQLICAPCMADVQVTTGKVTRVDVSEKIIKAQSLIECARNGCPRAQAALLVAFRNNVLDAIKATFVHDGATVLANKLLGS